MRPDNWSQIRCQNKINATQLRLTEEYYLISYLKFCHIFDVKYLISGKINSKCVEKLTEKNDHFRILRKSNQLADIFDFYVVTLLARKVAHML